MTLTREPPHSQTCDYCHCPEWCNRYSECALSVLQEQKRRDRGLEER